MSALCCGEAGSPPMILAGDGIISGPIADAMRATGQNRRLTRFAGQQATAARDVTVRGGSRGMMERVEAATAGR